jgi:O-antigen biosynthesis protein WbqP
LKRVVDVGLSLAALLVLSPVLLGLAVAVRLSSPGPAVHWSSRVGRNNRLFLMPKFRTLRDGAPQLATHLFTDVDRWTTPVGRLLRRTSLDEVPQLWSVLVGDMSLVGPRPALFNQDDLVAMRTEAGVHALRPGLTGWAQINGRDEIPLEQKVALDREYLKRASFAFDVYVMVLTAWRIAGAPLLRRLARRS